MRKNRNGLQMLRLNIDTDNFKEREQLFISFYKNEMPPKFKLFHTIYDVGRGKLVYENLHVDSISRLIPICMQEYHGLHSEYLGLYDLVSLEESVSSMEVAYSIDDEVLNMGFAYIGDCIDNIALMVGINEENCDQIYLECSDLFPGGDRFLKVEDDIFTFMSKFWLTERDRPIPELDNYELLYKNWGEDFWRVRE